MQGIVQPSHEWVDAGHAYRYHALVRSGVQQTEIGIIGRCAGTHDNGPERVLNTTVQNKKNQHVTLTSRGRTASLSDSTHLT